MSRHDPAHPSPSILVVDGFEDAAESEADLLSLLGYEVRFALNGADALLLVAARRPDVVLLDIRQPDTCGLAVARAIRQMCEGGKQPSIVAITGCCGEQYRLRSAQAGIDMHLVKPVDPAVLAGLLEKLSRARAPSNAVRDYEFIETPSYNRGGIMASI